MSVSARLCSWVCVWIVSNDVAVAIRTASEELLSYEFNTSSSAHESDPPCLFFHANYPAVNELCSYSLSPRSRAKVANDKITTQCNAANWKRKQKNVAVEVDIPLFGVPLVELKASFTGKGNLVWDKDGWNTHSYKELSVTAAIGFRVNLGLMLPALKLGVTFSFEFKGSIKVVCHTCKELTTLWSALILQLMWSSKDRINNAVWKSNFDAWWAEYTDRIPDSEKMNLDGSGRNTALFEIEYSGDFIATGGANVEIPGVIKVGASLNYNPRYMNSYALVITGEHTANSAKWVMEVQGNGAKQVIQIGATHMSDFFGSVDVNGFCDGTAFEFEVTLASVASTAQEQKDKISAPLKDGRDEVEQALGVLDIPTAVAKAADAVHGTMQNIKTEIAKAETYRNVVKHFTPQLEIAHVVQAVRRALNNVQCRSDHQTRDAAEAVKSLTWHFSKLIVTRQTQGSEILKGRIMSKADLEILNPVTNKKYFFFDGTSGGCKTDMGNGFRFAEITMMRAEDPTKEEVVQNKNLFGQAVEGLVALAGAKVETKILTDVFADGLPKAPVVEAIEDERKYPEPAPQSDSASEIPDFVWPERNTGGRQKVRLEVLREDSFVWPERNTGGRQKVHVQAPPTKDEEFFLRGMTGWEVLPPQSPVLTRQNAIRAKP